jgi:HSP20 family protein
MTILRFPELREFLNEDTRKTFIDCVVEDGKFFATTYKDFRPSVDIAESTEHFHILLSVPGMTKDDFTVELTGQRLVVKGERKLSEGLQGLTFLKREIKHGNFARSFFLPEGVDNNSVDAVYKDGVLTISLKKMTTEAAQAAASVKVK